jgi:putative endonuclease
MQKKLPKRELGSQKESESREFLEKNGLEFIEANYFCKMGEIDLIMDDHGVRVFVEVRYRKNSRYGDGVDSVTKQKQTKIIRAAKHYLVCHDLYDKIPCRFDVIAEDVNKNIIWIKDAFWIS